MGCNFLETEQFSNLPRPVCRAILRCILLPQARPRDPPRESKSFRILEIEKARRSRSERSDPEFSFLPNILSTLKP